MAFDPDDIVEILKLRLLIARAAQSDSLRWWDDNSLTESGLTLASRIFSQEPELACRRLAMRAADVRHRAAVPPGRGIVHLFNFGSEAELQIEPLLDSVAATLADPIANVGDLLAALAQHGIEASTPTMLNGYSALEMATSDSMSKIELARLLASGYSAGDVGRTVFPFVRLGSSHVT